MVVTKKITAAVKRDKGKKVHKRFGWANFF